MSVPGIRPTYANLVQVRINPVEEERPELAMSNIVALAAEHVQVNDDNAFGQCAGAQQGPVLHQVADAAGAFGLDQNGCGWKLDP